MQFKKYLPQSLRYKNVINFVYNFPSKNKYLLHDLGNIIFPYKTMCIWNTLGKKTCSETLELKQDFLFFISGVQGIKLKALHMLYKHAATELHPQHKMQGFQMYFPLQQCNFPTSC
jgi:hypothetical protein